MNENINIAEILKDASNNTMLYSPIYGKVRFDRLRTDNKTIEVSVDNAYKHFDYYGRAIWHNLSDVMLTGEECLLFPSKDNRDWSTFIAPWEHKSFKPFQKVLIPGIMDNVYYWSANFYSHYDKKHRVHYLIDGETINNDDYIISYEGNEDKLGKRI